MWCWPSSYARPGRKEKKYIYIYIYKLQTIEHLNNICGVTRQGQGLSTCNGNGSESISVEEFLYHLQSNPLLLIQALPALLMTWSSRNLGRRRGLVPKLHHHDPVGIGARPGPFLPNSYVRILRVQPQAGEGRRRWRFAAVLSEFGAEDRRECCRRRCQAVLDRAIIIGCVDWEIRFGIATAHQDCRFVVGFCCFFRCFKRPKPHPSFSIRNINIPHRQYYDN